jgi:hypothetical protein
VSAWKPSADICRENGWKVGDTLRGVDHVDTIVLTAIGLRNVLATRVNDLTGDCESGESCWELSFRQWEKVRPPVLGDADIARLRLAESRLRALCETLRSYEGTARLVAVGIAEAIEVALEGPNELG